jgi:hypothetical protein
MPKMVVDPLRTKGGGKFADLVGCTGVTMEDGRKFFANRRGHLDVDDVTTAKQMVDNPLAPGAVAFHNGGVPRASGVSCGTCGFGAFRFAASAPCTRCGATDWVDDPSREKGPIQ